MKKAFLFLLVLISQSAFADIKSDSDSLFNWAEEQYPALFSPANQPSQIYQQWYYRYYPTTKNYVGVNTSGEVWVLGDIFGGMLYINTLQALLENLESGNGISGNWSGTAQSSVYIGCNVQINISLNQNGSSLTGNGTLTGNCIGNDNVAITGSINGNNISYGIVLTDNTDINFTGTIANDLQTLTGSYVWPDDNDQGTWSLSLQ